MPFNRISLIFFLCLSFQLLLAQTKEHDTTLNVMKEELAREMEVLSKRDIPAYYIDYRITEVSTTGILASFGSLINASSNSIRIFSPNVKVGSYEFDNTHQISDENFEYNPESLGIHVIPLDNDAYLVKREIWQATQSAYKSSMETFKEVRTAAESKPKKEKIPDFSKEAPVQHYEARAHSVRYIWKRDEWETKLKKYSALFPATDFMSAEAAFRFETERKYFVNTEGTEIVQNLSNCYLFITAAVRADDGDLIPLTKSYYAPTPESMPTDEVVLADVQEMIKKLQALRKAPLAEPYTGPAILYAPSAGVFFHEIFGHRVEGHRLKNEMDGQTFKEKLNEQVLPKTLDVIFDPTVSTYEGKLLNGAYLFDDEGVKGQRVKAVDKGILKTFLMSRTPLANITASNGHGRSSIGMNAVSRQSNLIVENSKPLSMDELRKMLLKECVKQKKKYGYFFKEVIGGFTTTDRYNPNAFNIFPSEVYRIYVDGRPDELVRGVDLIGTPLAMFAEIVAAGDKKDVFIGFCGAESGSVPVSAIAPSLFVRRIETQKKPKVNQEATLLPSPTIKN